MTKISHLGAAVLAFAALTTPAFADDWTAVKLRGLVFGLYDGEWIRLERGVVIPDDQAIRTLASGRVTFQRGEETIEVGPDTQIQIVDRAGYSKYTTVNQYFGKVAIEAEVRDVQHFAVRTPHLAAVVKGTRFVVISDSDGATVNVQRGAVSVKDADSKQSTVVGAGQQAGTSDGTGMWVEGKGDLPPILAADGRPVAQDNRPDSPGNSAAADRGGAAQRGNSGEAGSAGKKGSGGEGNSGNGGGNSGGNSGNGGGNSGGNSGNGGGNSGGNSGKGGGNSGGNSGNGGGNSGGNSGSGGGNSGGNSGNGGGNSGNGGDNSGNGGDNSGGNSGNGGGNSGKGN